MLIAIDTATRFASLALFQPDIVLAEQTWRTNDNHTCELMPSLVEIMARQRLEPAQLEAVAVAIGPGSFTGLRIGLAVGKGLAASLGIPLVGIPTLDILPYAIGDPTIPTWSVIQAGRGRICFAEYRYESEGWERKTEMEVGTTADLLASVEGFAMICGELTPSDVEAIRARFGDSVRVPSPAFTLRRASYLADLAWRRLERGERDDVVTLSPIYIHKPEIGS